VTADLLVDLRNLALSISCILGAGAIGGFVAAEWAAMRDQRTGRAQPTPVWTAEQRWGSR
jgi:hypothetical protein